jgi:ATP-binding cassette subfamily B (MDR/TAP) protein 1
VVVQDAAFFDKVGPGEISMRATKDISAIHTALGKKLGYLIWSLSTVVAVSDVLNPLQRKTEIDPLQALTSSFAHSPRLAGVLFSIVPLIIATFTFLGWANKVIGGPVDSLEGQTSSLVEQVFASIRVVQSFNMGPSLIARLDNDLFKRLRKLGAKRSVVRALEQSSIYFANFLVYSLAFWYGGIQVRRGLATGNFVTVSFRGTARSTH